MMVAKANNNRLAVVYLASDGKQAGFDYGFYFPIVGKTRIGVFFSLTLSPIAERLQVLK